MPMYLKVSSDLRLHRSNSHNMAVTNRYSMSSQLFKSVYFSDVPTDSARRQSLTLAFGPGDRPLHDAISPNANGRIAVPQGPGLGIDPDPAVIAKLRVS